MASSNMLIDFTFSVAVLQKEFPFINSIKSFFCSASKESLSASFFYVTAQSSISNFVFLTSLLSSSISLRFTFFLFSTMLSLFSSSAIVYL